MNDPSNYQLAADIPPGKTGTIRNRTGLPCRFTAHMADGAKISVHLAPGAEVELTPGEGQISIDMEVCERQPMHVEPGRGLLS